MRLLRSWLRICPMICMAALLTWARDTGYLAANVAARCPHVTAIDLYEAEARALEPARRNMERAVHENGRELTFDVHGTMSPHALTVVTTPSSAIRRSIRAGRICPISVAPLSNARRALSFHKDDYGWWPIVIFRTSRHWLRISNRFARW